MTKHEEEKSMEEEKKKRELRIDIKEFADPAGGTALQVEVQEEEVEVQVASYDLGSIQPGDRYLRTEQGEYSPWLVFARLVPLSDAERELVQFVYEKTKDFTW